MTASGLRGLVGGGFMMFFVPPDRRMEVIHKLGEYDGQVSNCHFTKYGTQAWRL
jgi:D-glycero-alpha-D-manno-heptose-7-phosphate kinase